MSGFTKFARADRTARVEHREKWDYVKFPHAYAHIVVVLVGVYSSASSTQYTDKNNNNGAPYLDSLLLLRSAPALPLPPPLVPYVAN